ncbi:MAG: transposase [Planctomycetes bacterium]|nr:transposase [Planctomycetota bacterium]
MKTKNSSKKRKQRQYQPAEKVSIIRDHLVENKAISDVCDEHNIHPSVYYRWQKQLFEQGEKAFVPTNEKQAIGQLKQEVSRLEAKVARKDEVLGEVMEEYVRLKKKIGGS